MALGRTRRRSIVALVALVALFPAPIAVADQAPPTGQTEWQSGPNGKLYPAGGWKSCAEAAAHAATPVSKGEPGYNPALDPTGSGVECTLM